MNGEPLAKKSPSLKIVLMHLTKYLIIVLIIIAFNLQLRAQRHQSSGMIYDLQGRQSLSGVSASTADGRSTTMSDEQGAFSFNTPKAQGILRVSMLGYKTREVEYTSAQTLNIQLEPSTVSLNEVRVSGYNGNKTRKETA